MLSANTWPRWRGSAIEGVSLLLRSLPIPTAEFTFGRNKLFVRSPRTVFELEDFRRSRLHDLALLIQKNWRGYRERTRYQKLRRSQMIIASAWRSWKVNLFSSLNKFVINKLRNYYVIGIKARRYLSWSPTYLVSLQSGMSISIAQLGLQLLKYLLCYIHFLIIFCT